MSADLPIAQHRDAIVELLRTRGVLIVAGDTGSGKSTRLPQYCLEAGRGDGRIIAHTQPRRIAARALAARIAEERGEAVGATVGYRVRFADHVGAATRIVLMTDGLLLAELSRDPLLRRYDTVIVDEAHERSLNVDLLLGALRRLRVHRPDLVVVVTSATLDVVRLSAFFGDAPVVSVGARLFPIEVRYRPPELDADEADLPAAVLGAWRELAADPSIGGGDALVFLPGEREIADCGELLERELGDDVEVVPLYSRLAWEQQSRIFRPAERRRIVLATNVAETSLTVPRVRAVIDTGLARVSRYSPRTRLQRLPIEPVSRASAEQRKGRCGRIGAGVCIRLYAEEDYAGRPAYTEPEIQRTNLAALLLRLAADRLGPAEEFPFIDAPDGRALQDGYRLLQELGALDERRAITREGGLMARLPLDPRLARALLESRRLHAEAELLAITAALSVPDPRLPPAAGRSGESADPAPFEDSRSEFLTLARLWGAYRRMREGPRRELRRWCREQRLSLLRLGEWENVHAQLRDRAAEIGVRGTGRHASYAAVHRSLLAGFTTMVGARGEEGSYLGPRGLRFQLWPGSGLRRRKPRWVLAANIVETSRVYARTVASVEPAWIEAAAAHLLRRDYLDVDWDEHRAEVVARERTSLLGLVLRSDRIVNYGPVAPEEARRVFAREALVHGRLRERPAWLAANDAAVLAGQRIEERLRRRDLVATPEALVDFYTGVLPRQVSSAATLEHYTRQLDAAGLARLTLDDATLFVSRPGADELARYPQAVQAGSLHIAIEYRFQPGDADDGALLSVPLLALPGLASQVPAAAIPGYRMPRIDALLRSLPKEARRHLIPVAATAAAAEAALGADATDAPRLAAWLQDQRGVAPGELRFGAGGVPAWLVPQVAVMHDGRELGRGRSIASLRRDLAGEVRAALDRCARSDHPQPWQRFERPELPASHALDVDGGTIEVHPALRVRGAEVWHGYEWSAAEAAHQTLPALVELARRSLARPCRDLARRVAGDAPLLLAAHGVIAGEELPGLLVHRALRRACFPDTALPVRRTDFEQAVGQGGAGLAACLAAECVAARGWFATARSIRALLDDPRSRACAAQAAESREWLRELLDARALAAVPPDWDAQLPRYLQAEEKRWQRICTRGSESPRILEEITRWSARLRSLRAALEAEQRWSGPLEELAWWLRELRVSLTAQELRTRAPVSAQRLEERAAAVEAWLRR